MTTNIDIGLTNDEVENSRIKNGSNELIKTKKNSFFMLFIESLNDPIIKILFIALAIRIVFLFKNTDLYETIGILISAFLASTISAISEYSSSKAFDKLAEENAKISCNVRRNKKIEKIPISDVVVGDIVLLQTGDKIPSDGKIIEKEIYVDESAITGESQEKKKTYIENSRVFRGSVVTGKEATMLVSAVGKNTFYGNLAFSIQEKDLESPLKQRLKQLASLISKFGYFGAFFAMIAYLFNVVVLKNGFEIDKIISMLTNMDIILPHIFYSLTLAITIIIVSVPEDCCN